MTAWIFARRRRIMLTVILILAVPFGALTLYFYFGTAKEIAGAG